MKILITAPENENHTAPLKWALEQAGYSVACWAGLGWTEDKQASISLLADTQLKLGRHLVEPGDVIWIRRPVEPKPNPQRAPEDAKFAANEYRCFYDSLMYLLETLPVRVVNKYTASASEITSGALQDYHLATLIGTKTFGKGVVQSIYPMSDGGALKITTQRYVTPMGRDIQHRGIVPDIVVDQNADDPSLIGTKADKQLKAAEARLAQLAR